MPFEVVLSGRASTPTDGELASTIWTKESRGLLERLRMFGFSMTAEVFPVAEGFVAHANRTLERLSMRLAMFTSIAYQYWS